MANLIIIRKICSEQKITLKEFAARIDMTEHGLQRILKSNSTKIETLERIAQELNIPISSFFVDSVQLDVLFKADWISVLCERFEKVTDKISFLKDYYVWNVLAGINYKNEKFRYPINLNKDINGTITTTVFLADDINIIFPLANRLVSIPFSTWSKPDQDKLKDLPVFFEAFYYVLFNDNFWNICNYLKEGWILSDEIMYYWNKWIKEKR